MKLKLIYGVLFFSCVILLASCASSVRFSDDIKTGKSDLVEKKTTPKKNISKDDGPKTKTEKNIKTEAETWMGTPYVWGGTSKRGVDCSGFVMNVYQSVGINLPRTAAEQYDYVEKVDENEKKAGDLVFFKKKGYISHVGIYLGDNQIIHSSSGRGVIKQDFDDPYLQSMYVGAGRPHKLSASKK